MTAVSGMFKRLIDRRSFLPAYGTYCVGAILFLHYGR